MIVKPFSGPVRRVQWFKPGTERAVLEALKSEDAARRGAVIKRFNSASKQYTDALRTIGGGLLNLSSTSMFPSTQTQGVPTAVRFGTADRMMADMRWAAFFEVRDYRGATTPYFKIVDVYNAVTFSVYRLGEPIVLRPAEAAEVIYESEIVAGGMQWNLMWEQWTDLWSEDEGLTAMELKYADQQARTAYVTLTASGLSTTAYDTGGSTTLEKDVNTINAGILDIENALYSDTMTETGETIRERVRGPYGLLYNSLTAGYEDRIRRALGARYDLANDVNAAAQVLDRNVVAVGDPDVPTGAWYLSIPGRKNVLAVHKDLMIDPHVDPRVAGTAKAQIGQGAYKFVRGDAKQCRKLLLS